MSAAASNARPQDASWSPLREEAARLAAALPPFRAATPQPPPGLLGPHGRRRAGAGDEFWQYRRSQPGDNFAQIDWRRSARSDRLFVREREWQSSQTIWIWRDASASMAWASSGAVPEKGRRASVLAFALAMLLSEGGETVGALGGAEPPASGASGLRRFAHAVTEEPQFGADIPTADAIAPLNQAVLISDFLDDFDAVAHFAEACVAKGVRGCAVQILDPAEEDFPFEGRTRFEGVETSDRFLAGRADALGQAYRDALAEARERLEGLWREAGWAYLTHRTDRPARKTLLPLCRALAEDKSSGRGVSR